MLTSLPLTFSHGKWVNMNGFYRLPSFHQETHLAVSNPGLVILASGYGTYGTQDKPTAVSAVTEGRLSYALGERQDAEDSAG